jgi:hypothetical protein
MSEPDEEPITEEQALAIATADAVEVYGDLSKFTVTVRYKNERWFVDFKRIKDPARRFQTGGQPSYIVNAFDGRIMLKIYKQ